MNAIHRSPLPNFRSPLLKPKHMQIRTKHSPQNTGFTLTELAIVLIIISLLIGGMFVSLSTSRDIANEKETQKLLAAANDALLGFAAAHGRLPCPAAPPNAGGAESPLDNGVCTNALNGFLPAVTLGLSPTDDQGYLLDPWGNRIRYAVYNAAINAQSNAFTVAGKMKELGMETLSTNPPTSRKLLYVCNSATGITANDCGTANTLTDSAIAVVFSTGKNGGSAAASDEAKNTDNDLVFVSITPNAGASFDDVVTWLSPNILYNRMISASRLP